jgi:hypothetical protein
MTIQSLVLRVAIPSVDEFARKYRNYGPLARGDGRFLFDLLMSPDAYNRASVATLELELPAVAGIAKMCYQAVEKQQTIEWNDNVKRFIGAVVCCLMEANGYQKTGMKKAIPHHAFTKGEFYRRVSDSGTLRRVVYKRTGSSGRPRSVYGNVHT